MSERKKLSGLSALLINLSDQWGTSEKKTIQDAIILKEEGVQPLILCRSGSVLESEAQNNQIKKESIVNLADSFRSIIANYYELKRKLKETQFDMVHCYTYETLFALCTLLKDRLEVPLLFSYNYLPKVQYKRIEKFFFRRIDGVIVYDKSLRGVAEQTLNVVPKRILTLGSGVYLQKSKQNKQLHSDKFVVATKVPKGNYDPEDLLVFLQIISPLVNKSDVSALDKKIEFLLLTEGSWYEHPHYDKIKRIILERGLEYAIRFHPEPFSSQVFDQIHLLVSLDNDELLSSSELLSYAQSTPLVYPRAGYRFLDYSVKKLGESYKSHDARELRDKIIKVLADYPSYKKNLEEVTFSIQEEHSVQIYRRKLIELYDRILTQRHRLILKRRRS